jgi:hypothetical protein
MLEQLASIFLHHKRKERVADDVPAIDVQQPAACQIDLQDDSDVVEQCICHWGEVEEIRIVRTRLLQIALTFPKLANLVVEFLIRLSELSRYGFPAC